jgi:hypothetical protein
MKKKATVTQKMWDDAVAEYQLCASVFIKLDEYIELMVDQNGMTTEGEIEFSRQYSSAKTRYETAEKRIHDLRREMDIDLCCGRRKTPVPQFPNCRVRYSRDFPRKDFAMLKKVHDENPEAYKAMLHEQTLKGATAQ